MIECSWLNINVTIVTNQQKQIMINVYGIYDNSSALRHAPDLMALLPVLNYLAQSLR